MPTKPSSDSTLFLLRQIVRALEEKKAGDLCVLHVAGKSSITDYLVLATGTSEPHLRALRVELEKVIDAARAPIAGMDAGTYGSGWLVVDAYQIMMHLFTPEQRGNYALEKLWKDAETLDVVKLLAEPKSPRKTTAPKKAAKSPAKKSRPKPPAAAKSGKPAAKAKKPAAKKKKAG